MIRVCSEIGVRLSISDSRRFLVLSFLPDLAARPTMRRRSSCSTARPDEALLDSAEERYFSVWTDEFLAQEYYDSLLYPRPSRRTDPPEFCRAQRTFEKFISVVEPWSDLDR